MFSYQHFQLKFRDKISILYVKDQEREKNSQCLCFVKMKQICRAVSNIGLCLHLSSTLDHPCQKDSSVCSTTSGNGNTSFLLLALNTRTQMLKSNVFFYVCKRYHVLPSLLHVSISRISPLLIILVGSTLHEATVNSGQIMGEPLTYPATSLNRHFPLPPHTLSSTQPSYWQVPVHLMLTFTPRLCAFCFFGLDSFCQPTLTTCLLFSLQG